MPKYEVIQYYTTSEVYHVEAKDEAEASNLVSAGKVRAEFITGKEFSDEMIEVLEE